MKKRKTTKIVLIISIFFIITSITLIGLSFFKEQLDEKYKIYDKKNYISKEEKLSAGEIKVLQDIEYQKQGIFKITFKNYSKSLKGDLIKDNTNLTINGDISEDYNILNKVIINNYKYVLKDNKISTTEGIDLIHKNNSLEITIPNKMVNQTNEISIYIKLVSRQVKHKLYTNKDCYFSINPSDNNKYYSKSGNQSYIIYGKGYIVLK